MCTDDFVSQWKDDDDDVLTWEVYKGASIDQSDLTKLLSSPLDLLIFHLHFQISPPTPLLNQNGSN